MKQKRKSNPPARTGQGHKTKGFSLIECALTIAIVGLISVAGSNLILAAAQSNLNEQMMVQQQSVLNNLMQRTRLDMYNARTFQVVSQNELRVTSNDGVLTTYRYEAAPGFGATVRTLTREEGALGKVDLINDFLPTGFRGLQRFTCGESTSATNPVPVQGACFTSLITTDVDTTSGNSYQSATRVLIGQMTIADQSPAQTVLDNRLNTRNRFSIPQMTYTKLNNFEFS